jgi:hypothetical protein
MKITYCKECDGSSSQQENKASCLSFIKRLVYWYIQINDVLTNMFHVEKKK